MTTRFDQSMVGRRDNVYQYVDKVSFEASKFITLTVLEAVLMFDNDAAQIITRPWNDDEQLSGADRIRQLFMYILMHYNYKDPCLSDEKMSQLYELACNRVAYAQWCNPYAMWCDHDANAHT